jgi:two-component system chemotaxis response regulator CheY
MLPRVVLLIEDDLTCSEMVQMALLTVPGLLVKAVRSAAEARRSLATADPYALVVTDVHLPGEDGLSLVEALRNLPGRAALPIVVTTSDRDVAIRERADAIGVQAFFEKPFSPTQFRKAVNSILNGT